MIKLQKKQKNLYSFSDKSSGLLGFIAVNKLVKGETIGGTRVWSYAKISDASDDALRLSRAMTAKCKGAGIPLGGSKAVIYRKPNQKALSDAELFAYSEVLKSLPFTFYTGEDVGLSFANVNFLKKMAPKNIVGAGKIGDPSPMAALSVYQSLLGVIDAVPQKKKMSEMTFAIKGVGKVGKGLLEMIARHKPKKIYIADPSPQAIAAAKKIFPVTVVSTKKILELPVDVLMPCAVGTEFSYKNVGKVKAKIICGSGNNQLESEKIAEIMRKNGILYAPDYIANAGGLVHVAEEVVTPKYTRTAVTKKITLIRGRMKNIILYSVAKKRSTEYAAHKILHV